MTVENFTSAAETCFREASDIIETLETDTTLSRDMREHLLGELRTCLANYGHYMQKAMWLQMKPKDLPSEHRLEAA
jgi:hypothetical protein